MNDVDVNETDIPFSVRSKKTNKVKGRGFLCVLF